MLVDTEAIVLRTQRFGDTSLIATVYTQQLGKCAVLAKGARNLGSPHGAALEVPNHIRLAFYHRPRREVFLVRTAELRERFPRLRASLERTATALVVLESVQLTQAPEEPNPALYGILLQTLRTIEQTEQEPFVLAAAFLVRLCHLLGFAPSLSGTVEPSGHYTLSLSDGSFCPAPSTAPGAMVLSAAEVELLRALQKLPLEAIPLLAVPAETALRFVQGFSAYIGYHLEQPLQLRSLGLWNIIPAGSSP